MRGSDAAYEKTNLPIYVSPLGEKEKGLAFEYLCAFQSVV